MPTDAFDEVQTPGLPSSHDSCCGCWTTQRFLNRLSFPRVAHAVQKRGDASTEEPPMMFPCSRRLAALTFVLIFALSFAVAQGLAAG